MSATYSVVLIEKGHQAPEGLLKKIVEMNPSCCSVAIQGDGIVEVSKEMGATSLENVMALQFDQKDEDLVICLGNGNGSTILEDDLQPFTILEDKDGQPLLVAFCAGDFTSYYKKGTTHTNEFFFVNEFLIPKVKKMYALYGNDLKKFMDDFGDPATQSEYVPAFGEHGTLLLLAANKELQCIANNPDIREFPWGFASNTYGFGEATYPAKTAEPEKPKGKLGGLKMAAAPEGSDAPRTSVPSIQNQSKIEPIKADTIALKVSELGDTWGTYPKALHNKGEKKSFVQKFNAGPWDDVKGTYLNDPPPVFKIKPDLVELFKQRGGQLKDKPGTAGTAISDALKKAVDTKTDQQSVRTDHTKSVREPVPILDATELELGKTFINTLDSNHLIVCSPDKIPDIEKDYSTFTDDLGLATLANTYGWTFAERMDLVTQCPKAAAKLIFELTVGHATLSKEVEELRTKLEGETTVVPVRASRLSIAGSKK